MTENPFKFFVRSKNSQQQSVTAKKSFAEKPQPSTTNQEASESTYFAYITKDNTYHCAHVLNKIIKTKSENLKYACLVISYLPPDLSQRLLSEFPEDIQVQVVSELLSLIQYSKTELENFDKILRRLLTEQFGGKYVVTKLLEEIDIDKKFALMNEVSIRYPDAAALLRSVMILFEDILVLKDDDYSRIFSEVPNEILSMAFCNQSGEQQNRLYNTLSKGLRNIVQQGIDLGRRKFSRTEISKAQQYIIEYSKQLERDGFIDPILKDTSAPVPR